MKKHLLTCAFALLLVGFGTLNAQAQVLQPVNEKAPAPTIIAQPVRPILITPVGNCSNVVAAGCVGNCGAPSTTSFVVSGAFFQSFCLQNDQSSLCANTGAYAYVYRNGTLIAQGDITAVGSTINFWAFAGNTITVTVQTYGINNGIQCIWLGELYYSVKN